MELQQALERIKELETETAGLTKEKESLLRKRDELLGEVKTLKGKFSKFSAYADQDIDIDHLLEVKAKYESGTDDFKKELENAYRRDKQSLEARLQAIEKEREQEREQREREKLELEKAKLKTDAIAEFSKESYKIRKPEEFWRLFGEGIVQRSDTGKLMVGDEYRQLAINEYIEQINEDPENAHHFKPKGGSGSGTGAGTSIGGKNTVNPWKRETFNLTQQGQIVKTNPELAARLKSEAGVK